MAAKLQHLLLCVSVVTLLVVPLSCNASRIAEFEPGTRSLLPSIRASEDDTEVPTNDTDQRAPSSAIGSETEFNQWARLQQVQDVATDYTPPEANPDPGVPSPIGD